MTEQNPDAIAQQALALLFERAPQEVGLLIRGEWSTTGNPIDDEARNAAHALVNLAALTDLSFTTQQQVLARMQYRINRASPGEQPILQLIKDHTAKLLYDASADQLEASAQRMRGFIYQEPPILDVPAPPPENTIAGRVLKWLKDN